MVERFRAEPAPRRGNFRTDADFFDAISEYVQNHFSRLEEIQEVRDRASMRAYTLTNVTLLRTLDGAAGTASDVRSVLGTLITDLIQKGALRSKS
jgi:hypothetical protein